MAAIRDPHAEIWGDDDSADRTDDLEADEDFEEAEDRGYYLPSDEAKALGIKTIIHVWESWDQSGAGDGDQAQA